MSLQGLGENTGEGTVSGVSSVRLSRVLVPEVLRAAESLRRPDRAEVVLQVIGSGGRRSGDELNSNLRIPREQYVQIGEAGKR